MAEIWLIADLHLGHKKLIQGWDYDGIINSGPRKQFSDTQHMRDEIFDNWQSVVKPQDKIYVLGDIAWNEESVQDLAKLPGHKRAVLGNHDSGEPTTYDGVFKALYGAKTLPGGFVLTHIPVHESQLTRKSMTHNIHGHTHDEQIMDRFDPPMIDLRYTCVSCEQVNYTPINLEEIKAKLNV